MKTIWKYQLELTDDQFIEMPKDAKPLSVAVQRGVPCLWAEVDSDLSSSPVHIKIFGTGHPVPSGLRFIGTFQLGSFVWHVYQVQS